LGFVINHCFLQLANPATNVKRVKDVLPGLSTAPFSANIVGRGTHRGDYCPGSSSPNFIYVNFRQSATYNEQGFLLPLEILPARHLGENPQLREFDAGGNWLADPTPSEIAAALEAIRERVPERTWPVIYREDLTGRSDQEHVWSIPSSSLVRALFWRKDHFQEAGLDPEVAPATWDEFLEFARILHNPAIQRHAMIVPPGLNRAYPESALFPVTSWLEQLSKPRAGDLSPFPSALSSTAAALPPRDCARAQHPFCGLKASCNAAAGRFSTQPCGHGGLSRFSAVLARPV